MAQQINTPEQAKRKARVIISDICIYNQPKIKEGIEHDNLFEVLKEELSEGKQLYETSVPKEIRDAQDFFAEALIDILIYKHAALVKSEIW